MSSEKWILVAVLSATLGAIACGDDSLDSVEPTPTTTTTFDQAAVDYIVEFQLLETVEALGALQFDVNYYGSRGGWVGAACSWLVDAALHACNDKRAGRLTCAVVDTNGFGFPGPIPLLECDFRSTDPTVDAPDFSVNVTDASTPYLSPADATVVVSSVTAR